MVRVVGALPRGHAENLLFATLPRFPAFLTVLNFLLSLRSNSKRDLLLLAKGRGEGACARSRLFEFHYEWRDVQRIWEKSWKIGET
jgi:hypothetical protein